MKAAAIPSSAELTSRSAISDKPCRRVFGAAARDQHDGDGEQRAQRAEPDRDVRKQRAEIGQDEGDDDEGATARRPMLRFSDAISVARFARRQQPGAGGKAQKLEQRQGDGIGRIEPLQPERPAKPERDAAEQGDHLHRPRRMPPQMPSGDDQRAERNQRRGISDSGRATRCRSTTPCRASGTARRSRRSAIRSRFGQWAARVAPGRRHHRDAKPDGAAEVDDGIGRSPLMSLAARQLADGAANQRTQQRCGHDALRGRSMAAVRVRNQPRQSVPLLRPKISAIASYAISMPVEITIGANDIGCGAPRRLRRRSRGRT